MSTYVYMRILESAPHRYDLGIRLLSLGRVDAMYDAVAAAAVSGDTNPRILELGCGTGNLTARLLARGATVMAIDQDPEMLAVAREKLRGEPRLTLQEMAAVEIADRFPAGGFDAVAGTLVLSEMSEDEQGTLSFTASSPRGTSFTLPSGMSLWASEGMSLVQLLQSPRRRRA